MKKFKKIVSVMLAVVLVLAMSITVSAADDYKIVITNSREGVSMDGKEYTAYKLFDVSMNVDNKAYVYTVSEAFKDFDYKGHIGTDLVAYVGTLDNDSAALNEFAKAVYDYLGSAKGVVTATGTAENDSVTINVPAEGYYMVYGTATATESKEEVVAAISLTTTNPIGNITLKADAPTIDKVIVNADSAVDTGTDGKGTAQDVGSTVQFELNSQVPNMEGYTEYTYNVHDTMSSGLTFNEDSVKVYIGSNNDVEYPTNNYSVVTKDLADGCTFEIRFNAEEFAKLTAGDPIKIIYNAVLNDNALTATEETNKVKLEYSNNPYGDGTGETPEKEVYVYDFDIVIDKYEKDKETTKLAGAKFILQNAEGKYYYVDDETKKVDWVESEDAATIMTTDSKGSTRFTGLDSGNYKLIEKEAPAGYNKLVDPVNVEITVNYDENGKIIGSSTKVDENGQYSLTSKIENTTGSLLPSTGGIGTTIFYIIGGILVIGAGIILVVKKRMSQE